MNKASAPFHLDGCKPEARTRHLSAARVSTLADRPFLGVETSRFFGFHWLTILLAVVCLELGFLNDQLDATVLTELSQIAELEQEREFDLNSILQDKDTVISRSDHLEIVKSARNEGSYFRWRSNHSA